MLNQSTLLLTRKNPTNFAHSRRQSPKIRFASGSVLYVLNILRSQPRLEVCSKQIEIRRTCTRNSTEEPFLLYLMYTSNFPDFLHYIVLHSGEFLFELEILILLLEEVCHWWESWEQSFCRLLFSCMFSLALHLKAEHSSSYFQPAYLFGQCSQISIPKAEQSAYNVIYPFSKDILKRSGSEIKRILCIKYHKWR